MAEVRENDLTRESRRIMPTRYVQQSVEKVVLQSPLWLAVCLAHFIVLHIALPPTLLRQAVAQAPN